MGRVYGEPFTVPCVLFGDGFDCNVQVTFKPYHNETPTEAQNREDTQFVRGTSGGDVTISLDDPSKGQLVAGSCFRNERLRLKMPDGEMWGCELIESDPSYQKLKVRLTRPQP